MPQEPKYAQPRYKEIADRLRIAIDEGELAPGGQLPTEIALMTTYDASRNTVRDAIKLLTGRGLVETRPGQGTFVVEKVNPFVTTLTSDPGAGLAGWEGGIHIAEVRASDRTPDSTQPRVEVQRADLVLANALHVDEGSQVVSRHQQQSIDGIPWAMQTSFYPMDYVTRGASRLLEATDIAAGTVAYLADTCGVHQAGYRDTISVRPPDENEIRYFKLPRDGRVEVMESFRLGFDEAGNRIRLTITVYPSDRNWLRVEVGKVPPRGSGREAHM